MPRKVVGRRKAATPSRRGAGARSHADSAVVLDAEDIALARLQVQLRRTEAIEASARPAASPVGRITVRLPGELLARLRRQAGRDGVSLSEAVTRAVERFLRSA